MGIVFGWLEKLFDCPFVDSYGVILLMEFRAIVAARHSGGGKTGPKSELSGV